MGSRERGLHACRGRPRHGSSPRLVWTREVMALIGATAATRTTPAGKHSPGSLLCRWVWLRGPWRSVVDHDRSVLDGQSFTGTRLETPPCGVSPARRSEPP